MAKRGRKKKHGDFGATNNYAPKTQLVEEYFEDIELTDPNTGEKKLYKNVKIKRYATVNSVEKLGKPLGASRDAISDAEEREGDGFILTDDE